MRIRTCDWQADRALAASGGVPSGRVSFTRQAHSLPGLADCDQPRRRPPLAFRTPHSAHGSP